jgi:LacI family transcriptional regulator
VWSANESGCLQRTPAFALGKRTGEKKHCRRCVNDGRIVLVRTGRVRKVLTSSDAQAYIESVYMKPVTYGWILRSFIFFQSCVTGYRSDDDGEADMATIRDVARLAGVSVATVSRVLNQNGYVNKETEQKVRRAIEQLRYEPNAVARGLAGKQTGTIALILPDITNPFFPEMARGVEDAAQAQGYTVILCNSDDQGQKEKSYIEMLRKKYIDGIIFASNTLGHEDVEQMRSNNIPLVVLDRAPTRQLCSVIRSQNYEGAKLAVRHLLDVGCRKIAHIYGPQELITAKKRLLGYEETVMHFPWYTPSLMVPGHFRVDGGFDAVKELLKRHPDVDGIFCGNDLMAVGALKALYQLGVRVPEDVALIGFDGIGLTELTQPELSTVAQPIYEMGVLAAKVLMETIETGVMEPRLYELEVTLVARESTKRRAEA